jgi:hypothetical protein
VGRAARRAIEPERADAAIGGAPSGLGRKRN